MSVDVQGKLTEAQRRLVRTHMGLVGVHLRRNVPDLWKRVCDREREDLFQEGCLGLIGAAQSWKPGGKISFPAYALPRIQNAVGHALPETQPWEKRRRKKKSGKKNRNPTEEPQGAAEARFPRRVRLLDDHPDRRDRPQTRRDPSRGYNEAGVETAGDRLGQKFQRALRQAGTELTTQRAGRGNRDQLVRTVMQERLLIPSAEHRRPLRRIAQECRSSYARVFHCEKQLSTKAARYLGSDPEFVELWRRARRHSAGLDLPMDAQLERGLIAAFAQELIDRLHRSNGVQRGILVQRMLDVLPGELEAFIRQTVFRWPASAREKLSRCFSEPR